MFGELLEISECSQAACSDVWTVRDVQFLQRVLQHVEPGQEPVIHFGTSSYWQSPQRSLLLWDKSDQKHSTYMQNTIEWNEWIVHVPDRSRQRENEVRVEKTKLFTKIDQSCVIDECVVHVYFL